MNWTKTLAFVALVAFLALLGYFVWTFHENVELFKADPLKYAIVFHGYDSCTCSEGNRVWQANATDIWTTTFTEQPRLNFSYASGS